MSARPGRRFAAWTLALLALVLGSGSARAELGLPDGSYREAQMILRETVRDTAGHADDAARMNALGGALLRLARFADADHAFRRVLAAHPDDRAALAGAGHIALCQGRTAEAESLLVLAGDADDAVRDLYLARLRRYEYGAAAAMSEDQGDGGRRDLLERLDGKWPSEPTGRDCAIAFVRGWPVPLVRAQVNKVMVTLAVDPSAGELLLDASAARRCNVEFVAGERPVAWCGTRVAARGAVVRALRLGDMELTGVPAAVVALHRYSLTVNPEGADIAGVIGLPVLERFGVTIDFRKQVLELRLNRDEAVVRPGQRVPFERWGENELMVYGSLQGGRRMAFWVGSGLPEAALGAPQETFDEVGAKPGRFANMVRTLGTALRGRPWSQVTASTLTVGPVVVDHVNGWSGAMDAAELWRHGARRDGLLGPRFFVGQRVTFDWARHELVFEDGGK